MRTAAHAGVVLAVLALAACATAPAPPTPPAAAGGPAPGTTPGGTERAFANVIASSGSLVSGRLTLMPMAGGIHVAGDIGGLAPNSSHGFHVHEHGDCSAADGSSAGGHFNPTGSPHGNAESGPHHAGDIDNLRADDAGVAHVNALLHDVVLGGGGGNDLIGRAFIVHAAPDDYRTQPSGNSGARIACGVITAAP
jgi:Cu-Zn family superoxide dismutase